MFTEYDVIVVGGGHAGCEAAAAAANLGSSTLLITMDMGRLGQMSCNPAMGGVAKGQIVREIDALGGYSGIVSDMSAIQFRLLNRSKGPAMWSPRTQNDRELFTKYWRQLLEETPNLDFWQDMVTTLEVSKNQITGVKTSLGTSIKAKSVILTNGTFLNGLIHIGEKQFGGGRAGERQATGLTESLIDLGFEHGRMKTGTPPRVDGRSLDFSKMEEHGGDENPGKFSFSNTTPLSKQRSCYITYTNNETHELLRAGFDRSPMFNGAIKSTGPRYCPSIEDKISRFAERERHQIFVEPEGWNTVEIYVNGFSTSLPEEIQYKALKSVIGFENVKFFRPGYAIEYDYFPPTQLKQTLETKLIDNLYFAGQINGTTGYEEAASQGLMAGINAHLKNKEKEPFILNRDEAYIGVLIDDLITKGTEEPYRMFTSRAEFRILLRQDNADIRLTEKSFNIGLASKERYQNVLKKIDATSSLINLYNKQSVLPEEMNPMLKTVGSKPITQKVKLKTVLLRPQISTDMVLASSNHIQSKVTAIPNATEDVIEQAEIQLKYQGYLDKERDNAEKMRNLENIKLTPNFNYSSIKSLSAEAVEKLSKLQPNSIGQASRISGVSPSDISILLVYLGR